MRASLIAILLVGLLAGTSIAIDAVPASASLVTQKYAFDKSSLLQTAIRPGRGYFIDNRKKKDRKKKKSCTPNLPRISCHGREGIFFQRNGGSINKVNNPNTVTPLPVPTGDTLNIAVCNLDNLEFNTGSLANLIRPLVGIVEDNADVRIVIEHSANLLVNDQYTLPAGMSVIGTLIQGAIGENVNIEVDIIGSANIHLADDKATATLTGSNLIAPIIDGLTNNAATECLTGCMKVNIQDSANIVGKRKQNDVTLEDDAASGASAALENGAIRAQCLENAHVEVNKRNVATIYGARDVTVDDSSLSVDNVRSAVSTRFSTINMHLDNFGTVSAKGEVTVENGGFLIDSAVDLAGTVVGSTIHVDGHRVGTVRTKDLTVNGMGGPSALVSNFVLVGTTSGGTVIIVDVDRLGDVLAYGAVNLNMGAELVRDVIEFVDATDTEIILHGTIIGSVYADDLTLEDTGTSLVESLLNFATCNMGCEYDIHLFDVGNTEVTDTVTLMAGTALIQQFILASGTPPVANAKDLILQVKNAGNVLCPGGRRRHAQLQIDAGASLIQAVIRVVNANLGQWTAQEFAIVLHFLANVQVLNNQDDNFDFFDEDTITLLVVAGDLTPANAMLQLTESETGDFTRCIRPPRNPKSKEKGRKNERKGGNKNRRNKNRHNKNGRNKNGRNNKRRNKKRHNGPK